MEICLHVLIILFLFEVLIDKPQTTRNLILYQGLAVPMSVSKTKQMNLS